jgi:3-oxoacyl-[acyl-carrier-protein] synthase III
VIHAHLAATGAYLPGPPISNARLEELVGPLPEEILEGLQVKTRHWIADPDSGEHTDSTSGMALAASREALLRAELEPAAIDLIVTSTSSPEYLLPPMATFLQDLLGLERCTTIELRSGCAGAVEAIDIARMYIERGEKTTALVVGSESISPLLIPIFRGRDPDLVRMRDRITLYNFGDGAGALVLRASEEPGGFQAYASACVGGGHKPGMQIVGGGTHRPIHQQLEAPRVVDLRLDVVASTQFTPVVLDEALAAILAAAQLTADEIDLCVIPEGNAGYLVDELASRGELAAAWRSLRTKIHENLDRVGATGSAALPLALDDAWCRGRIAPGARVVLLALETSKWIYAASQLTWTAARPPHPSAVRA